MIIDTLKNAGRYFAIHPGFEKAFTYIRSLELMSVETGIYAIDGDRLKAIFSNRQGMTVAESVSEFECHNRHIDIQYCIVGKEKFGWKPRQNCVSENGGYDDLQDVQLYHDAPDMFFELTDGQFVILFPEDVHAPMISDREVKKLVIKVKIDQ